MEFRPCIDIHNGKVKQIVGASLNDNNEAPSENYVSSRGADFYARMYKELGLKGGHIILLNPADSPYYELTRHQGIRALSATPGLLQIGGGVTPDNAASYIEAGASHVIVTSYVFSGGKIKKNNLKKLVRTVGSERLVLDLSCKKRDGDYYIVTDRWQKFTDVKLCAETMDELSQYCDEFLVHAADVEGQQNGIEENVARILGEWAQKPVTYAGGVKNLKDIDKLKKIGKGKVDVTVGSALDIFGGHLSMDEVIKKCR
jgi:phosphoribosylformimino-5-aminoimidazole carboxamide ribotide isomerase